MVTHDNTDVGGGETSPSYREASQSVHRYTARKRILTEDRKFHFIPMENATGLDLFHPHERAVLERIVSSYKAVQVEGIYTPAVNISIETPYIFFHQRKAGGQSLRYELEKAAKKLELPYYIACQNHVGCDLYTLPTSPRYAIYGMHLEWGTHKTLVNGQPSGDQSTNSNDVKPSAHHGSRPLNFFLSL